MYFGKIINTVIILVVLTFIESKAADDDYNVLKTDGSYDFGYNNPDSYHYAQANRNNVVKGEFGGRNPKTGAIDTTIYTAGPRGFRPRGKNIARKYDLSQAGPRPVGSRYDPYYDPYEDPSYSFSFRTRTYSRDENANRVGDVNGKYSYIDDVGERHNVEFIAGKNTGFHVKTPFPDSNPRAYGPLFFRGRGRPIPRGRTSIQRGLDGSYKFVSAGPDQRRTETSDATGHVRGSYTYLDDKGVQHSVHYIAGPETGYRVLKNVKGPHLPSVFPFQHPDIIPPDFYDLPDKDVFDTAASGDGRPGGRPGSRPGGRPLGGGTGLKDDDNGIDLGDDGFADTSKSGGGRPSFGDDFGDKLKPGGDKSGYDDDFIPKPGGGRPDYEDDFKPRPGFGSDFGNRRPPTRKPSPLDDTGDEDTDFGDLFGDSGGGKGSKDKAGNTGGNRASTTTNKPSRPGGGSGGSKEDSYGSKEDGSYSPSNEYIPPSGNKGGASNEDYGSKGDDYGRPSSGTSSKPPATRPQTGVSKPSGKPQGTFSTEDDDFGLFGSESNRPRPPYTNERDRTGPVITIGGPNRDCPKCAGAVLTNVGDTYLSVPPGVSVRAHVQAIDLLPYSSRFPGPSEQYKADLSHNTEQLNSEKDKIVSKIEDTTEINEDDSENDESSTTEEEEEETTTEVDVTTSLPNNTTTT